MLEKMGWSKGKGLGPKEDGSQDFVRVRYKNDIQGLGFEQRDDQWTQHESSFSGLLKSLNGDKPEDENVRENAESEDEIPRIGFGFQNENKQQCLKNDKKSKLKESISGVSLEEKSKQSKARVHYKKFTRGKDLSQYSEKDLANIFGRKSADDREAATADIYQQLNNFNNNVEDKPENNVPENFGGVQTVSTGLSVSDYFKMKMAALKNRTTHTNQASEELANNEDNTGEASAEETLTKKKRKKRDISVECEAVPEDIQPKKRKLRTKEDDVYEETEVSPVNGHEMDDSRKMKKKKKSKIDTQMVEHNVETVECTHSRDETMSGARDHRLQPQKNSEIPPSEEISEHCSSKKSKKSKYKHKKNKQNSVSGAIEPKDLDHIKNLHLQDLQAKLNTFNVYRLSSFCAEKFRNLNLSYFPDSSLSQIEGYGINKEVQLKIETIKTDEMRITRLWDNTLSKYALMEKETKKAYQKYVNETFKARKQKEKRPTLHFKAFKRKNAFAII